MIGIPSILPISDPLLVPVFTANEVFKDEFFLGEDFLSFNDIFVFCINVLVVLEWLENLSDKTKPASSNF